MAAFTLTPSGVKPDADAVVRSIGSSESHNPGQAITSLGAVVDPDDSDKFDIIGLSVSYGDTTGLTVVVIQGDVSVSNTLTPQRQIIAAPSGQLQYDDDLLVGDGYVIVGYTKDANTITILPTNTYAIKA